MFNNPVHQEIDEKESSQTESRVLVDDGDDDRNQSSSGSEELIDPTKQNIDASQFEDQSSVQQFGNQFFELNTTDHNQSKASQKDYGTQNPKNLGAADAEVRTSGGQLLHHFRIERESERGDFRKENVQNLVEKRESSNNSDWPPYSDERKETARDIMMRQEIDKLKYAPQSGGSQRKLNENEFYQSKALVMKEQFRQELESQQRSRSDGMMVSDTNDYQIRNTVESSRDEAKDSDTNTPVHIADNPFQILSIDQQKQGEQEFKGDLRETANFDPLVQNSDSPNKLRGSEKHYNPFSLSKTEEHETMLRPSGDFGYHKSPLTENFKYSKKSELNEISENPAEYRDSVLEDTEKSSFQHRGADNGAFPSTGAQQNAHEKLNTKSGNLDLIKRPEKPAKMIGLDRIFDGEEGEDKQHGAPMFKNMFYKTQENQNASLNSSNQKTDSVISRSREPSHINRGTEEAGTKNESGNLRLINLDGIRLDKQQATKPLHQNVIQANVISEANDSYTQEEHSRSQIEDSNIYNKIHKVLQEENDQSDLNETQKQLIQDMNNEQRRTLLSHLLLNNDFDPRSGWAERLSSISRALERKSGLTEHGDAHNFINQEDIDFFSKLLDISAIPHANDNHAELNMDQFLTPRELEARLQDRIPPKIGNKNLKLEEMLQTRQKQIEEPQKQPEQQKIQSKAILSTKQDFLFNETEPQSKKKTDFMFQKAESLQYNPPGYKEQPTLAEKVNNPQLQDRVQTISTGKGFSDSKTKQEEPKITPTTLASSGGSLYTSSLDRLKLRAELQQNMMSLQKDLLERRQGLNNLQTLISPKTPEQSNTGEKEKPIQKYEYKPLLSLSSQEAAKSLVENFLNKNYGKEVVLKGDSLNRDERFSETGSVRSQSDSIKSEKARYQELEPRGTESGTITSKKNYVLQADVQPFRDTLTVTSGASVLYQHSKKAHDEFLNYGKLREQASESQRESLRSQKDFITGISHGLQGTERSSPNFHNNSSYSSKGRSHDTERVALVQQEVFSVPTLQNFSASPNIAKVDEGANVRNISRGSDTSRDYKAAHNSDIYEPNQKNYQYVSNRQSFDNGGPDEASIRYKKTVSIPYDPNQTSSQKALDNDQNPRITETYTLSVKPPLFQKSSKEAVPINTKHTEKAKSSMPNPKMAIGRETEKSDSSHRQNSIKNPGNNADESHDMLNEVFEEKHTPISIPKIIINSAKVKFESGLLPKKNSGFRTKDDIPYRPIEARKINRDIFCIDCEEFISLDQVDTHSGYCAKNLEPQKRKGIFESATSLAQEEETKAEDVGQKLEDLNQKIEKIVVKLNDHLRVAGQKVTRQEFSDSCKKLVKIARDVVSEDSNADALQRKMQDFDQTFAPISTSTRDLEMIGTIIYLQRLFVALQQKAEILKPAPKNTHVIQLQEELQIYERETVRRKAEVELWQYQTQMLQDIQRNDARNMKYLRTELKRNVEVLSQIQSEIGSSADPSEDTIGTTESDASIARSPAKGSADMDREALRRYFYTEAVNFKLTLPANHPGRHLLISDLYDQCVAQNVQKEDYVVFIKQRYNLS